MKKLSSLQVGILYSIVHFSVEVACFYFLFSRAGLDYLWVTFALLFDALAFLPQSIFGVLSDRFPNFNYGATGLIMIFIALILPFNVVALVIISLGNALVHIDGAQHTLNNAKKKITPNAIFVGGGSFGVITGQLLGALRINSLISIPILLIIISITFSIIIFKKNSINPQNQKDNIPFNVHKNIPVYALILLALIAVSARSYIAYAIPIGWKKTTFQSILLFVFMGIGKILGGIFADTIGYKKTTYLSLLIALPFLLFGNSVMIISLIGVMLFSMTMPITVGILFSKFPNMPGLAFGITTLGLFVGVIPKFFINLNGLFTHQAVSFTLSIIALISILSCLKKEK